MIKMKLSTVLLSSAALLVAGAAYAADLPAKKAAPAKAAATGCAAFGASYIAIPGGDTCLLISGYVAYEGTYAQTANTYGQDGFYRLNVTAQNNTEIGAVKSFARVNAYSGNANSPEGGSALNTDRANVSFSGVTAGLVDSISDIGGSSAYWFGTGVGEGTTAGIQYSVPLGSAATLTIAEENAATDGTSNTYTEGRPDILAKLSGSAGALKYNVVGVSHAAVDSATGATGQGYAFLAQASASVGSMGAILWGGTSYGAMAYTSGLPSATTSYDMTSGTMSKGTNFGGEINTTVSGTKIALAVTSTSATTAAGATTNTTTTDLYVNIPIAKGLSIQPELINTSVTGSSTNTAYLFIERDF